MNSVPKKLDKLLKELKEKEEIETLCSNYALSLPLLKEIYHHESKGYDNKEIAQHLGIHLVTIQRYAKELKRMNSSNFARLLNYINSNMESELRGIKNE